MSRSTQQVIPEDLDAVKAWFRELAEHVQAVDFAAARHLFAADFVAFGTFTDFMIGRDLAENNQWRNVWPTIDSFVWRLDDAKALVSPDRLFAVGLAVWDSTGYHPDGKPFEPAPRPAPGWAPAPPRAWPVQPARPVRRPHRSRGGRCRWPGSSRGRSTPTTRPAAPA